jgi:hypothetical protein
MRGHECYHCKQWIDEGQAHDCWTTTEAALTRELSDDLRDAWERLRETLADFGEQRVYASHSSIMFARKACYAFVRPRRKFLEVYFFLGRTVRTPPVRKSMASSRLKIAHEARITHRDQVEAPLTDWIREAYEKSDELSGRRGAGKGRRPAGKAAPPAPAKTKTVSKKTKAATTAAATAVPRRKIPRKPARARGRSARR